MGSRSRCLLVAVDNAAAVEIVWAELNRDAVAGEDADEVFAHTSGDVCKGLVLVLKLDLEHRIRQGFDNHRHHFNCIFLRQTISFGGEEANPLYLHNFFYKLSVFLNQSYRATHLRTPHLL
jgi:hypothetical protein